VKKYIPVIDLFAGPGGLGEGFSAFHDSKGHQPFKIKMSIEKDYSAHATLELRAFYREFKRSSVPKDYYNYLRGEISRDDLFIKYPKQSANARIQAWQAELGCGNPSNENIDRRIQNAIDHHSVWVLIGGPPCQAYSIIGRSKMKNHKADFENDQRHFLYKEYLRIVAVHKPPVFIMENVQGILSSKINGENIIDKILSDLRNPISTLPSNSGSEEDSNRIKYNIYSLVKPLLEEGNLKPGDYVIKSESYGIPQKRHRVILLGIRSDLPVKPTTLSKASEMCSIEKAIYDLPKLRSGVSKEKDSPELWKSILENIPKCAWINDKHVNPKLRKTLYSFSKAINSRLNMGSHFLRTNNKPEFADDWFVDNKLGGVINHVARKHMRSDLYRYFFASCFANLNRRSPMLVDFPREILPKHDNVQKGVQGKMFSDRFKVQLTGKPSTTITAHISKDGHYYIHPDPSQCRSLTVREAARLQTFPDNYLFEGTQTQQYHQVGNAVPPLLALQIAEIVYSTIP
jgi:DNA (cytosine-5)-methyltransferase 1